MSPPKSSPPLGGLPALKALAQEFDLWNNVRALPGLDPRTSKPKRYTSRSGSAPACRAAPPDWAGGFPGAVSWTKTWQTGPITSKAGNAPGGDCSRGASGSSSGVRVMVAIVGTIYLSRLAAGRRIYAVLGALITKIIDNGIVILGIDQNYSRIIIGVAVILAVVLDQFNGWLARRRLARAA